MAFVFMVFTFPPTGPLPSGNSPFTVAFLPRCLNGYQGCSFRMPENVLLLGTGDLAHGGYELVRTRIRDFMFDQNVKRADTLAIVGFVRLVLWTNDHAFERHTAIEALRPCKRQHIGCRHFATTSSQRV
jgi:hypothetical protein